MRGPIQLQTILQVPILFSKMPYVSFFCDTRWVPTRFPPNIMGGFLSNKNKNKNSQFYAQMQWA
jgi:hypothetical protein